MKFPAHWKDKTSERKGERIGLVGAVRAPPSIYTFVGDDGENIHIDAEGLRRWCIVNKPEIFWLPIRLEVADTFLRDNVISMARVSELRKRGKLDPIIMVKDGTFDSKGAPNALLVDGHHRYFIAVQDGLAVTEGHMLEVEQWKPFQVHGIPPLTKDQLRQMPPTKRNY